MAENTVPAAPVEHFPADKLTPGNWYLQSTGTPLCEGAFRVLAAEPMNAAQVALIVEDSNGRSPISVEVGPKLFRDAPDSAIAEACDKRDRRALTNDVRRLALVFDSDVPLPRYASLHVTAAYANPDDLRIAAAALDLDVQGDHDDTGRVTAATPARRYGEPGLTITLHYHPARS